MKKQRDERPILIVEDLPSDARLIERSMKKARIANPLELVRDGQEAIDYLADACEHNERLPVLVLLDLKLPKKDGFDVLKWMRETDVIKLIPVVILTSSNRSPDINRAYELGANSYLVKPVEDDALVDMFKTLDVYWLILNTHPELETE